VGRPEVIWLSCGCCVMKSYHTLRGNKAHWTTGRDGADWYAAVRSQVTSGCGGLDFAVGFSYAVASPTRVNASG
jgi:hypothetical protein